MKSERKVLVARVRAAHQGATSPLIMGIVNVTPDSFSDGGRYVTPSEALVHAHRLHGEGALLLDIGAESTRPGHVPVSAEEEWRRLAPVVGALTQMQGGPWVSVDTSKAVIAAQALAMGASMVNDVWGFQADPHMASVVAEHEVMAVVLYNRHEVDPTLNLWDDARRFFDHMLYQARQAGIRQEQLVLDPGIGFGKTQEQNWQAVRMIGKMRVQYDMPVLLGLSRKSLFGQALGREVNERLPATLAANFYALLQGAAILRVHDVQAHADMVQIRQILESAA